MTHVKVGSVVTGGTQVFQNNFLVGKASPNSSMMKSFYNSKQIANPVQIIGANVSN